MPVLREPVICLFTVGGVMGECSVLAVYRVSESPVIMGGIYGERERT